MNKLELQKTANEIRKGSSPQSTALSQAIRADPCQRQISLHICILRK